MNNIPFFDQEILEKALKYNLLIEALRVAFQEDYTIPLRHHHDYKNPEENKDSTLLLMPAWKAGEHLGIKIVTISPNNSKYSLPSIQGLYVLFDAHKGIPIAQMDAKCLTNLRTAAASALASDFLSRTNSESLLMVGTGSLAPYLIQAHAAIRPIKKIWIWGRNIEKAITLSKKLSHLKLEIEAVKNIEDYTSKADIISCATMSKEPLVFGNWLRDGQHLDLVGSYSPTMRETDDVAISKSRVYVDVFEGATKESGDIVIPLKNGTLKKDEIIGDLFALCRKKCLGRQSSSELTLFKSVGHALEDLAAARLALQVFQ